MRGSIGALGLFSPHHVVLASIATWLEHFHGPLAYVLLGACVFGEASVMLGFVIPGETAALVGGVLAAVGSVDLVTITVVVVACAIAGDSVGYEVGRRVGPWLLERRRLKDKQGVEKAQHLVERYGGLAVLLGRWTAFARAVVPGITGMSRLSYVKFLFFNAVGGIAWGVTFVLIGYVVGRQFESVLSTTSTISYVLLGVLAAALIGYIAWRTIRARRTRRESESSETEAASSDVPAGEVDSDTEAANTDRG